jgi:hypothetical protein
VGRKNCEPIWCDAYNPVILYDLGCVNPLERMDGYGVIVEVSLQNQTTVVTGGNIGIGARAERSVCGADLFLASGGSRRDSWQTA